MELTDENQQWAGGKLRSFEGMFWVLRKITARLTEHDLFHFAADSLSSGMPATLSVRAIYYPVKR